MNGFDDRPRLDSDERHELVSAAQSAEARNRPTGLLVLGASALVLSFGVFAWSYSGAARANNDLDRNERRYEGTLELAAQFVAMNAAGTSEEDAKCTEPVQNFLSRMEQLARRATIEPPSPPRIQNTLLPSGFRRMVYPYNGVTDESIENLLEWIRLAQAEVPCLELTSLKIVPETRGTRNDWVADITFTRLER